MRTYWLKIVLGALGVFALGMLGITLTRRAISKARHIAHSTEPITVPLAFVPFRVDGDRLGTFDQAVVIRKTPHEVSALKLHVKLADSANAARVEGCDLLVRFEPAHGHGKAQFSDADFGCVHGDSAGVPGAAPFGTVSFEPGGVTRPLYVPADVARRLRTDFVKDGTDASADSIAEMADSLADAAGRLADSITTSHTLRADSIREAALARADSLRARARRLRDSLHGSTR